MLDWFKKKVTCPICHTQFVPKENDVKQTIETITNYGEENQDSKNTSICERCDGLRKNLSD